MLQAQGPKKTEAGVKFPAAAYAYVPDRNKPSTWKLRLWETPRKKETARQVGMAVAALGKGFRGRKVQIPRQDLPAVKRKVLSAWKKTHKGAKRQEIPAVLRSAEEVRDEIYNMMSRAYGIIAQAQKRKTTRHGLYGYPPLERAGKKKMKAAADAMGPGTITTPQYAFEGVAPPGMEKTVKELKKDPEVSNPWALAWWIKKRKKGKASNSTAASYEDTLELSAATDEFKQLHAQGRIPKVFFAAAEGHGWAQSVLLKGDLGACAIYQEQPW